jgi:S-disulfanyl-L-cysteine oxidoreductase SoxD
MRQLVGIASALYAVSVIYAGFAAAAGARQAASRTVWDGAFTTAQADRGRVQFAAHCAACHGSDLQGGQGKALTEKQFWADWGDRTVGDLVAYVSKNMPSSDDGTLAGTLPSSTYVDIVAHILRTNGFPAGPQELTPDSGTGVRIVNKDGPSELPASTVARLVGCLGPKGADGNWRVTKASRPERATPPPATAARDVPAGDREYALKFVLRNLTTMVGHKVAVTGLLLGDGGVDGLNVNTVESVADTCN